MDYIVGNNSIFVTIIHSRLIGVTITSHPSKLPAQFPPKSIDINMEQQHIARQAPKYHSEIFKIYIAYFIVYIWIGETK